MCIRDSLSKIIQDSDTEDIFSPYFSTFTSVEFIWHLSVPVVKLDAIQYFKILILTGIVKEIFQVDYVNLPK